MGIDGGGSGVRVVITSPDLVILGSGEGASANPNSAGHDLAAQAIHSAMRAALETANLSPDDIAAVGAGIAGTTTARDWVRETVAAVLPSVAQHIASDVEIALVGAHGERRGVLILAGTGSVAYGINDAGESAQVGGWGYLLGDEGSGYMIGLLALQAVVRAADGRAQPTALTDAILNALNLSAPKELIQWVYAPNRTRDIARLALLVLDTDDTVANHIVSKAVAELYYAGKTVAHRLQIKTPAYAFAGGLLNEPNHLSLGLSTALGLSALPVPKYPPVIGAALLALTE
jgi:N-acetylglucosamine kinase